MARKEELSHLELVVEMLCVRGKSGATYKEIAAATRLTEGEVWTAVRGAEEDRIGDNNGERVWLSEYELAGLHPNAGEVMAWLKDGPLPRLYIEEHRREMRAALNQLVKRGLVKSIGRGAGGACYRTDRPKTVDRASNLARFCRALVHVDPRERRILGEWI